MDIRQIGNYWIAFLPGRIRVPGQFRVRSLAIKAYQEYIADINSGIVNPYIKAEVVAEAPKEEISVQIIATPEELFSSIPKNPSEPNKGSRPAIKSKGKPKK